MFDNLELPNETIDKIYDDGFHPAAVEVGKTFADLWFLVFGGISHAANKKRMKFSAAVEKYHDELEDSIGNIPPERICEPSFQTTAQALENSKYCITSEYLRKMFVKLIAGTMDAKFEPYTHPSFPEIIKQMSPLDAELLSTFKTSSSQPIANFILSYQNGTEQPVEQYIFFDINGSHSYHYAASISSLERFGLLSIDFSQWLSKPSAYDIFTNFPYFKHLQSEYKNKESGAVIEIEKGVCRITPLGIHFIKSCLP
ncbi:MAG: DUF4393 domain-containing protein [Blautia hansenii]